jgi:hypothetical protein
VTKHKGTWIGTWNKRFNNRTHRMPSHNKLNHGCINASLADGRFVTDNVNNDLTKCLHCGEKCLVLNERGQCHLFLAILRATSWSELP